MERGDADAMRLQLAEAFRADSFGGDAVRFRTSLELVESAELVLVHRDDHLAADVVRNFLLDAKAKEQLPPARAELRLQRTWRVVDARVNDAAVPARLMESRRPLLVRDDDAPGGPAHCELDGAREAEDPRPDHDRVGPPRKLRTHDH